MGKRSNHHQLADVAFHPRTGPLHTLLLNTGRVGKRINHGQLAGRGLPSTQRSVAHAIVEHGSCGQAQQSSPISRRGLPSTQRSVAHAIVEIRFLVVSDAPGICSSFACFCGHNFQALTTICTLHDIISCLRCGCPCNIAYGCEFSIVVPIASSKM